MAWGAWQQRARARASSSGPDRLRPLRLVQPELHLRDSPARAAYIIIPLLPPASAQGCSHTPGLRPCTRLAPLRPQLRDCSPTPRRSVSPARPPAPAPVRPLALCPPNTANAVSSSGQETLGLSRFSNVSASSPCPDIRPHRTTSGLDPFAPALPSLVQEPSPRPVRRDQPSRCQPNVVASYRRSFHCNRPEPTDGSGLLDQTTPSTRRTYRQGSPPYCVQISALPCALRCTPWPLQSQASARPTTAGLTAFLDAWMVHPGGLFR